MSWIKGIRDSIFNPQEHAILKSGETAEKKVAQALIQLKKEGKIKGFKKTEKFSEEDKKGIDFIIYQDFPTPVYIQVKSHLNKEEINSLKLERVDYDIWFKGGIFTFQAAPNDSVKKIKNKIERILMIIAKKL
jgi:hypothetical protein